MKKSVILFVLVMSIGFVNAAECNLDASLVNQDPYPATPGDYVKVVFQLTGVENPECGRINFNLIEEYPFSLDPGINPNNSIIGGIFVDDFKDYWNIPYRIRVDENALDGENKIEVKYHTQQFGEIIFFKNEFNITVDDVRTDFEVSIKDYDATTNTMTFEILNIGEHDAEALTIEIPKQDNVRIKGGNRNIVGDLDSNEDTTFSYEAIPKDGEINLKIVYTDELSIRRELEKTLKYDSYYFTDRKRDEEVPRSTSFYIGIGVFALIIILWIRSIFKKKRKQKERGKLFEERSREHHGESHGKRRGKK